MSKLKNISSGFVRRWRSSTTWNIIRWSNIGNHHWKLRIWESGSIVGILQTTRFDSHVPFFTLVPFFSALYWLERKCFAIPKDRIKGGEASLHFLCFRKRQLCPTSVWPDVIQSSQNRFPTKIAKVVFTLKWCFSKYPKSHLIFGLLL